MSPVWTQLKSASFRVRHRFTTGHLSYCQASSSAFSFIQAWVWQYIMLTCPRIKCRSKSHSNIRFNKSAEYIQYCGYQFYPVIDVNHLGLWVHPSFSPKLNIHNCIKEISHESKPCLSFGIKQMIYFKLGHWSVCSFSGPSFLQHTNHFCIGGHH